MLTHDEQLSNSASCLVLAAILRLFGVLVSLSQESLSFCMTTFSMFGTLARGSLRLVLFPLDFSSLQPQKIILSNYE
jgi:hypothetical protein